MVGGSEYPREKTGERRESKIARDLHTPRRPLAVLLCENNVNKSSGAGVLLLLLLFQIFLHDLEDQVGDAAALPFRLTLRALNWLVTRRLICVSVFAMKHPLSLYNIIQHCFTPLLTVFVLLCYTKQSYYLQKGEFLCI